MAKKKKVDFQKVKFKAGRSLKKNTNVTNTSFKVKKIVLKEKSETEPAQHHKLNATELLIRLRHHNSSVRNETLIGLKQLLTDNPEIIISSLSVLIAKVTEMIIDKDDLTRKMALKTLEVIFKNSTSDRIAPFFSTLKSYLNCSATHIISIIHNDSLNFLDLLLKYFPSLTTRTCGKVLENIVEISTRDISKAMTKKKLEILLRLEAFLEATLTTEKINHFANERKSFASSKSLKSDYNPFYRNGGLNSPIKDHFNLHPNLTVFPETESIIGNQVCGVNFLTTVKNFLLEFLNDCKSSLLLLSSDKQNKFVTLQVIQNVMNVLILLQTCANYSDTMNGTCKMVETYYSLFASDDLKKFTSFFPFNIQSELSVITQNKENPCVYFNLCVCDVFIGTFPKTTQTKIYEKMIKYIIKCLKNDEISGKKLTSKTIKLVENLSNSKVDKELLEELLCALYNTYKQWKLGRKDKEEAMKYFVELSLKTNSYFINSSVFEDWMKSILQEFFDIVRENPSALTIFCIAKNANTLALRGLPLFLEELQKSCNSILDVFTIVCEKYPEEFDLQFCIVELLSFLPKYTKEFFIQLINAFIKPYIPTKPILYLIELLHARILWRVSNIDIGLYISFLLELILGILKKDATDIFEEYSKDEKWLQMKTIISFSETSFVIIPSDLNHFNRHMNLVEKICDMIFLCNVENLSVNIQNFIQAIFAQYPCFPTYSAVSILLLHKKMSKISAGSDDYQNSLMNLTLSLLFHSVVAVNSVQCNKNENESILRIVCQFLAELNLSSRLCNTIWNSVKATNFQQAAILGVTFLLLLKNHIFGKEEIVIVDNVLLELKTKFPEMPNKKLWMDLNYYVKLFKSSSINLTKT